tara:strand:- start:585 stop:1217 length:633 start_codon:yes stop_codon:yes gene_type:complete
MSSVKLISHSVGVNGESLKNLVIYCARVSNPDSQELGNNPDRLFKYLLDNKHFSPFEMVNVCLEINTTRDIARQVLRHRSFSFQEFSQRYADPITALTFELKKARLQDSKNRQNSIEVDDKRINELWVAGQKRVKDVAISEYLKAIDLGIAKEQARSVLPEGITGSRLYMNGSLRSWLHYIEVRSDLSTQKEHRTIADQCEVIIKTLLKD